MAFKGRANEDGRKTHTHVQNDYVMCLLEKLSHAELNKFSGEDINSVDVVRNTFTSISRVKLERCFDACRVWKKTQ